LTKHADAFRVGFEDGSADVGCWLMM